MADFLLEIGCEEIPARMLDAGAAALKERVATLLQHEQLAGDGVEVFATPRRLAVLAHGVVSVQPDVEEQVIGPSLKVAFKDGQPGPPAEAFAKKIGIPVSKLERLQTPKGEYLSAQVTKKGRRAAAVLAEALPREIAAIPWPKSMYWRGKSAERFIRPVRWMVALLDGEVVPVEFGGVTAGKASQGHRLAGREVSIARPTDYLAALVKGSVLADVVAREQRIRKSLDAATRAVPGTRWREDAALLRTVVNLTEWPSAILGAFDPAFLTLPEEVLVTVMRDHQKYFAVEGAHGKLAPHFLAVLNTAPDEATAAVIRHGHERVLRARFTDARFFWDSDQKTPLRDRVPKLKAVTFHKDLGSYYDKTERVTRLAGRIAEDLKAAGVSLNTDVVREAAQLCKTDLTTELVKEFTELQGVVGGLYARAQGHTEGVAQAIYDHYKPQSMEDAVPSTVEGAVLSIADKADSIAAMFALGLQPTGSKDPFALRRSANGIVKTIARKGLPVLLSGLFREAAGKGDVAAGIASFFRERLEFYLREVRGFAYDVVNAVLAAGTDDVVDATARAAAVSDVRRAQEGDFTSIAVAFKRMKNILRQAEQAGKRPAATLDAAQLREEAEVALARHSAAAAQQVAALRAQNKYTEALAAIARLRPHVDLFFDKVMVMVEDDTLRANRLALLQQLLNDFSTIADFSEIVTEGERPANKDS
jgi:glycyl-tRNA synthetase beta chain